MPAVTRIGDADVAHCSGMTRAVGSSDVFANVIAEADNQILIQHILNLQLYV